MIFSLFSDVVEALILGLEVNDSLALLWLDDLFLDSFEVTDVKDLKEDHFDKVKLIKGRLEDVQELQGKKFDVCNVTDEIK